MMKAIDGSIRSFRNNLIELANSKDHLITQELITEIKGILSALDSVKLDNMFLSKSDTLRLQNDSQVLESNRAGLLNVLADGEAMLYDLRNNLGKQNLSTLEENQVRNVNYVAKERLRGFVHNIHPYSIKSYVRLDNYANELGLRNRFKTIRNELENKNEDKLKTWLDWTDKTLPEAPKYNKPNWREHTFGQTHHNTESQRFENRASITSRNVTGHYYTDTKRFEFPLYRKEETTLGFQNQNQNHTPAEIQFETEEVNRLRRSKSTVGFNSPGRTDDSWKKHAIEAGINLNFPGTTEQKSRYQPPKKIEYRNFIINPQIDTTSLNRPYSVAASSTVNTEYKTRFKFPDSNEIDKFPWIKQF